MLVDPARTALDKASGQDRGESLECLTPGVCFAEADDWPGSYFYSPWPLSENYYLVSFSYDPLPGGYTREYRNTQTGLFYFDRFGNLELLFWREGISSVYPIPLTPRPMAPVRASASDTQGGEEGEFLVADVNNSLLALPSGRRVETLRVFQLLPKSRTDMAHDPRIGHPDQANARMLLGTVPVEADGSAYFRAPARKPLYFQAVDAAGRALQGMRSVVYLQPGERRGCVGCHEPHTAAADPRAILAAKRPPSRIQPGPDGSLPFCYPRLIQPILASPWRRGAVELWRREDCHCVEPGMSQELSKILVGIWAAVGFLQSRQAVISQITHGCDLGLGVQVPLEAAAESSSDNANAHLPRRGLGHDGGGTCCWGGFHRFGGNRGG
jgi:hypothetical protein